MPPNQCFVHRVDDKQSGYLETEGLVVYSMDEQNRKSAEPVCNLVKCSKGRWQLLSTYSSPCFSVKIVHNYALRLYRPFHHSTICNTVHVSGDSRLISGLKWWSRKLHTLQVLFSKRANNYRRDQMICSKSELY
jgi:hypothetical protein